MWLVPGHSSHEPRSYVTSLRAAGRGKAKPMIRHLDVRPRRRPWIERVGLRRDLSERLILRLDPLAGDLVDETAGWVAADEADRVDWKARSALS